MRTWLLIALTMSIVATPADAQRRRRAVRPAPPPVIWVQPPAEQLIPTIILPPPVMEPAEPVPARAPVVALPEGVKAMLDRAMKDNDPAAVAALVRFAREANPQHVTQIDAMNAEFQARVAEARARAAREKADRLASAAFLDLWKGEVEIGGSRSTGNTESLGVYGSFKLAREGFRWRHELRGRADLQETNDKTTAERALALWQLRYKFDDRLYAFGLGQYEHDRFAGYRTRVTGGGGLGYTAISTPDLKIDLEGGPALRITDFYNETDERTLAGRASMSIRWKITPTLSLNQDTAFYVEEDRNNLSAVAALDTKLLGALKARFSYQLTYESNPADLRKELDTLTRATLVYSF